MILTLTDRNVLDEEEDELENIQLREKQQSVINQRMKRAISKRNAASTTFEEEFPQMEDHPGEKTHSLLPKYDELELANYPRNRFRLSSLTEKEREAVFRERVQNLKQQFSAIRREENAVVSETRVQGEYFTSKELSGFGKLKKNSGKKKKKKNSSRRLINVEDNGEEDWARTEAANAEIPHFNIDPDERLKRLHELRFQDANGDKSSNGPSPFEAIYNRSGDTQQESSGWRRVRFLRERGADRVLNAIQETGFFESSKSDTEQGNETLVLDDLTEFVYNLDPDSFPRDDRVSTKALSPLSPVAKVSREEETSIHHDEERGNISMSSEHSDRDGRDDMINDLDSNETDRKEDLEADLVSIGLEEEPVSMGVSAALKHLQMTGNLRQDIEQVGRTKDERIADARQSEEGSKRIKLEYIDEFGRELTPKEAFRQLSYKFHGKGPGKAKQEKRLRKYIQELRSKMLSSGDDTPLHSVRHLKEETKQSAVPYVVLQSSTLSQEMNSREHSRGRVTSTWERTDLRKPQNRKKQSSSAASSPLSVSSKTNEEAKDVGNASHVVAVAMSNEGSRSVELAQPERNRIAIQLGRNAKRKRPVLQKQSFE
ncbi:SART-1 family protein DOT2 [Galdieria sulphuraria]|nr:SART-1 family protein DOT2 [Galdieria sulphuraria]